MDMFFQGTSYSQQLGQDLASERSSAKSDRAVSAVRDMEDRIERLQLGCQAMWELIRDRTQITEHDLEAKILEIDARDGKVDGKMSTQSLTCHSCGRPTNSKRDRCVMCGAELRKQHKFES